MPQAKKRNGNVDLNVRKGILLQALLDGTTLIAQPSSFASQAMPLKKTLGGMPPFVQEQLIDY